MFLRSFQGSGGILRPPAIPKLINGTSNEPQLITINHMQGTIKLNLPESWLVGRKPLSRTLRVAGHLVSSRAAPCSFAAPQPSANRPSDISGFTAALAKILL